MDVAGKKAIIFGGASGMGRATAQRLSKAGATVVVVDRDTEAARAAAAADGLTFHPLDVTDFDHVEPVLQEVVDDLGGLHIAITTAGGGIAERTLGRNGPHQLDSFRSVLDLNIVATFNLNRLSAAHMSRNEPENEERGVIINTASIAAFEGQIGQVAYSAAKAAIAGMALTMARDLGSFGIRVVAIAPSLFATGAVEGIPEEHVAPLVAGNAFPKRMGRPEEYASLAAAVIENQMLNGQCLRLDAGMRFAPR